jgi:hypothetical protein
MVAIAAIATAIADEKRFWDDTAVLYAKVSAVDFDRHDGHILRITPIATLTGPVDAAQYEELSAHITIDPGTGVGLISSSFTAAPRIGSNVIVTVTWNTAWNKLNGKQTFFVPGSNVFFMPGRMGLVEVTGFDDPKVTETIENLRKLRGKQREEAEKAKAEQKSVTEKKDK